MSAEALAQPVFDPSDVAATLDFLEAQLPLGRAYRLGYVAGSSVSSLRGDGSQVRNIRDYRLGDKTRHIDPRLSAKSPDGQLKVREFNRDINPNLWVVTDTLQSSYDAVSHNKEYFSKQRLGLAASIGMLLLASQQGLPGTIIGANDKAVDTLTPLLRGRSHLANVAEQTAETMSRQQDLEYLLRTTSETEITRPRLHHLLRYAGERCSNGIVVIVSDFRDSGPNDPELGWTEALETLHDQGNQLIAVTITSPSDEKLPDAPRLATEQGVVVIGHGKLGESQRAAYEKSAVAETLAINAALDSANAQRLQLSTTDPNWLDSLVDQVGQWESISI